MKEANDAKMYQKEVGYQVLNLKERMIFFSKSSNPEELFPFEYAETERIT